MAGVAGDCVAVIRRTAGAACRLNTLATVGTPAADIASSPMGTDFKFVWMPNKL